MDVGTTWKHIEESADRAPAWRWKLSRWFARQNPFRLRYPVPTWIEDAVAFLRARKQCHSDEDRRQVAEQFPSLVAARNLARDRTSLRWEIEARILAAQTDEQIASRCGLQPAAAGAFERLFFHVRDRLEARDWVVGSLLGPGAWLGYRRKEARQLWRHVGFYAGSVMLQLVVDATRAGVGGCAMPAGMPTRLTPSHPVSLDLHLAIERFLRNIGWRENSVLEQEFHPVHVEQLAVLDSLNRRAQASHCPLKGDLMDANPAAQLPSTRSSEQKAEQDERTKLSQPEKGESTQAA